MQEVLENQNTGLNINDIRALVQADSKAVNQLILARLSSDVALINELGRYIINSGGKRLRPLLVLLFSVALGWTPVSGNLEPGSLILPAVTLGLSMAAITTRMVRGSLLEIETQPFLRTARCKGLSEPAVMLRHALPNALPPVIMVLGLQLGGLLAGAVITEVVFAWPGMGRVAVEAILTRDYPLILATTAMAAVVVVIGVIGFLLDGICVKLIRRFSWHEQD